MATKRRKRRKSSGLRGTPTDHLLQAARSEETVIEALRYTRDCDSAIKAVQESTAMEVHAGAAGPDGSKFKRAARQLGVNARKQVRKFCGCGGSR